jgi:hypothetical protein
MRKDDIRAMHKALGTRGFVQALADLTEGRDQLGKQTTKLDPARVSLRMLWEALVGDVEETLPSFGGSKIGNFMTGGASDGRELREAIDSTAFPLATGVLISSKVIEAYENTPTIGDELCTVMPSRLRSERFVGFTHLEGPMEVAEGASYEESGFDEKFVTTETTKKGRILEITEEAILFDQTGQIMVRAQSLGERTRMEREETILSGVLDVGSGAVGYKDVYRPSGVAATLYSAGNQNLLATATPLVDWTDLDEAMRFAAITMVDDRATTADRRPVTFNPKVLLVGRELWATGSRILNATETRTGDITTGTGSQMLTGNIVGTMVPGLRVLSSPLIDFLGTVSGSRYDDASDWFLGDFRRQFVWQEIFPLQTMRAAETDIARWRRDIVMGVKVRYFGGLFASDTKSVLKINAV